MTLPVAKNCKMTKKSDIDDVINTSKMSDMRQNSYIDLNVLLYCTYQISSPCKVITHLPWPIYLKKTPQDLSGGCTPPYLESIA